MVEQHNAKPEISLLNPAEGKCLMSVYEMLCISAWLPKESFGVKVQIKRSEVDKVTGCMVLVDTLAGACTRCKGGFTEKKRKRSFSSIIATTQYE